MNIKNIVVLTSIIITLFLSIYILDIHKKLSTELVVTEQKIEGLRRIGNIHNIDIALKYRRGLSQLNQASEIIKNDISASNNHILNNLKKLKNNEPISMFTIIMENEQILSKSELFTKYTKILKILNNDSKNIAESSNLIYESQKDINILISIAIFNVSSAIEEIGQLRAIVSRILNSKKHDTKDMYLIKNNLNSFINYMDNIEFLIDKLPVDKKNEFIHLIDESMNGYYMVNKIVNNIEERECSMDADKYFLKATKFVNDVNNIFIASKEIIVNKLELRKEDIENKQLLNIVIYILILILILIITLYSYRKIHIEKKLLLKKTEEENFIKLLHNNYAKAYSLKDICKNSLQHLISNFGAIDASIYLYDEENKKLYLGATYGIKDEDMKNTLNLNENRISENILEKKINILNIEKSVNLGNHQFKITKIVTIPILEFDKSIGTIQLSFNHKFKKIDIDYLQYIVNLMGTYIFKTQIDNHETSYLQLIDDNIIMSRTDLNGNITEVSSELCRLSQYSKEELIGQNHRIFKHEDMPQEIFKQLWKTILRGETWRGEVKDKKKDGSFYWSDSIISCNKDINGNIIGYVAIRHNITDKKKVEEIAITDGLTSLYNRRHFDNIFSQQIRINKRAKGMLAFVLIDIDHFKQYNDTYGHQDGDATLKHVANALKRTLKRPDDYVFRLGGEEFGLLYHVKNEEDSYLIANEARKNVENLHIEHVKSTASKYITISSGLYSIKFDDITSEEEIYKKSDEALYVAKESGRNRVECVSIENSNTTEPLSDLR